MKEKKLVTLECVNKDLGFVTYYKSEEVVMIPEKYEEPQVELRAAWIATVGHIDVPGCTDVSTFKNAYEKALDSMQEYNMNAVFMQIRPMNDAFYESKLNPYSRYLCGGVDGFVEGKKPDFDVLNYMISEAKKRGMEFHAWLNPYRVSATKRLSTLEMTLEEKHNLMNEDLSKLHPSNFAKQNPETLLMSLDGQLIYNPGHPVAQKFIVDTIQEIIEHYPVDGIHFDDYFYPSSGIDKDISDQATYELYGNGLSMTDFRRSSVTTLVKNIKTLVDLHNEKGNRVIFGISPFGMWRHVKNDSRGSNSDGSEAYTTWYADLVDWVEQEYLHYIMPQLYWEFEHSVARYADLCDWWSKLMKDSNVILYLGTPLSRFDSYKDTVDRYTAPNMLRYAQKDGVVKGHVIWHNKKLYAADNEELVASQQILKQMWKNKPHMPKYPFEQK